MKPATAINVRHILCEKHSRAMEALEQIQVSKSLGVVYLFVRMGLVLLWVQEQNFSLYDVGIMMFGPAFPLMRWGFTCPLLIFLSYFR